MSLDDYRTKRQLNKTPEPTGELADWFEQGAMSS